VEIPFSLIFPSFIPVSVRNITEPTGTWRYPEERSSPLLSGMNRSLFKASSESFTTETNGKSLEKMVHIAGVDDPFIGEGKLVSCSEGGKMGGFLEWLEGGSKSKAGNEKDPLTPWRLNIV
jgi:hypothetical protein